MLKFIWKNSKMKRIKLRIFIIIFIKKKISAIKLEMKKRNAKHHEYLIFGFNKKRLVLILVKDETSFRTI